MVECGRITLEQEASIRLVPRACRRDVIPKDDWRFPLLRCGEDVLLEVTLDGGPSIHCVACGPVGFAETRMK